MCGYCNVVAELVHGGVIYPRRHDLRLLKFWLCRQCGAYTGTHINSPTHAPKGGLARTERRLARIEAHKAFDPLWRGGGMTRAAAYAWLRLKLGLNDAPHIGFMDEAQCKRVVEICRESP